MTTENREEAILSLDQVREALLSQMREIQSEARMLRERMTEIEDRIRGVGEAQAALERLAANSKARDSA